MNERVMGLDPGLTGAMALIESSLDMLVVWDIPTALSGTGKRREVVPALIADIIQGWRPDLCVVERVHAMPGQGVASVFSFGQTYGILLGVLSALRVPVLRVAPGDWKRKMKLDQDKSGARAMAIRLFPHEAHYFSRVKDHDRAEAALLAWFGLNTMRT